MSSIRNRNLFLLLCAAAVVFIAISVLLQLPANYERAGFIFEDAVSYREAGRALYKESFSAHPVRTFGYPLLIGIPYLFGAATDAAILQFSVVINILAWLGSVLLMYLIASKLTTSKYAIAAAGLFICTSTNIPMLYQSMTETVFIFTILAFLYYLLRYLYENSSGALLTALFFICFSVTVRPISLYFSVAVFLFSVILFVARKQYRSIGIAVLIYAITIGTQLLIMQQTYGKPTISFIQNYTVYSYVLNKADYMKSDKQMSFADFSIARDARIDSVVRAEIKDPNDLKQYWPAADKYYALSIKQSIEDNKKNILVTLLNNMRDNSTKGSNTIQVLANEQNKRGFETAKNLLLHVTLWQNKLFSLLALVTPVLILLIAIRRKTGVPQLKFIIAITVMLLYYFFTSGISYWQGDRFSQVWYPGLIIILIYLAKYAGGTIIAGKQQTSN